MPIYRFVCDKCGDFYAWNDEIDKNNPVCPDCNGPAQWRPGYVSTIYNAWGFGRTDKALKSDPRKVKPKLREKMLKPEKGYKSD